MVFFIRSLDFFLKSELIMKECNMVEMNYNKF